MSTIVQDIPCPSTQFLDFFPPLECADLPVNQIGHGFVFGNVVKCIATDTYALAQSDDPADAEVAGIVIRVIDADNFVLHFIGETDGFTGLIPATVYFLSDITPGLLTVVEPTTAGHVSKPLLISHSTTSGLFFNFRGMVIGSETGLPDSGVVAGTYTLSTITVDSKGIITAASTGAAGGSGTVTSVSAALPISVSSPTTTPNITISQSGFATDGYLSSVDWNTFNNKQNALTIGNLTDAGTDGLVITGGIGSVIGTGTSLAQHVADATHNGYLSSADWVRFNAAATATQTHTVTFVVDGAGTVLTTGTKNPIKVPYGGTLAGWTMMCSPSGSVTADVFRAANAAGLPVTSIVGGAGVKPAIATNVENSSTSFTNWTSTTITAKDNLAISLSGVTAATYMELTLYYA